MTTAPVLYTIITIADQATTKEETTMFQQVDDFNSEYPWMTENTIMGALNNAKCITFLFDNYKDSLNGISEFICC